MRSILLLIIIVVLSACSAHKGMQLQKAGYVVPGNSTVSLTASPMRSISFEYFQCGGFYIKVGNEAILIDPFFSSTPMLSKLKTDSAAIQLALGKLQTGLVKGVLVTHAHYDHLQDVPYIMQRYLTPDAKLVVNATGAKIAAHLKVDSTNIINAEKQGGFIPLSKNFRVLPLVTTHPPHIGNLHLYDGEFNPTKSPTKKGFWGCGQPFAYLVDVMEGDNIALRILVQTSSSLEALKNIPDSVLSAKAVDIAILPAALFSKVKGYPDDVLTKLKPGYTIVCHWENFFKPYSKLTQKPYTVAATNVLKFAKIVEQNVGKDKFRIPMPGSSIEVGY